MFAGGSRPLQAPVRVSGRSVRNHPPRSVDARNPVVRCGEVQSLSPDAFRDRAEYRFSAFSVHPFRWSGISTGWGPAAEPAGTRWQTWERARRRGSGPPECPRRPAWRAVPAETPRPAGGCTEGGPARDAWGYLALLRPVSATAEMRNRSSAHRRSLSPHETESPRARKKNRPPGMPGAGSRFPMTAFGLPEQVVHGLVHHRRPGAGAADSLEAEPEVQRADVRTGGRVH